MGIAQLKRSYTRGATETQLVGKALEACIGAAGLPSGLFAVQPNILFTVHEGVPFEGDDARAHKMGL
jgi:hypothetical protein